MARVVQRAYGRGALIPMGIYDAEDANPGLNQETGLTFAASDFQFQSDSQPFTALTAEYAAFTSGSVKPYVGQTISGATNSETAIVIGVVLSSGSWSGADAAGTIFVEQVSGAWTSENVDNDTTGTTNDFTLSADFTAAIGAAMVGVGAWVALTSTELQCAQGFLRLDDQTATEVFIDDDVSVETFGHPLSMYPTGGGDATHLVSTTIEGSPASQTDIDLAEGPTDDAGLPANSMVIFTDQSDPEQKSVTWVSSYDQSDNKRLQLKAAPGFTVVAGDIVDIYAVNPILTAILADTDLIGTPADTDIATDIANVNALVDTAQLDLDILTSGIISGFTAVTGTLSTTVCTTDITGYADDELIGRVIVFTGGTAAGQAAAITDYASTNGTVTFSGGVTTAPVNLDPFVIV